jgi:ribosomal protein S18 acetylase RimI-like enzyme
MVLTFSDSRPSGGPRPIDPTRDFPQLTKLLRKVFADELEADDQHPFLSAGIADSPSFLWRLDPFLNRLVPGFVWEEDGRIVGNVTLLPTRSPRRFLVANVATEPDFRRQGIARALMEAAAKEARRHGAGEIRLQVERDNAAALALYSSLGYAALGALTTWRLLDLRPYAAAGAFAAGGNDAEIIRLPQSRWREAYELDIAALGKDLSWPEPLTVNAYRQGWPRRLGDFLNGRSFEAWTAKDGSGALAGLACIYGEWGRSFQLRVRVRPDRRGRLEAALVEKLIHRLGHLPRRRVFLAHDAGDAAMNEVLPAARFRADRTLAQMRLLFD